MYNTKEFMGQAQGDVLLTDAETGNNLYNKVKNILMSKIKEEGVEASFVEDTVKSGGIFSGTQFPILIIKNPNPANKFFDIGVYVNGHTVSFPLLGVSAENTKANKKAMYLNEGKYIRGMIVNPDELKLQQEAEWQARIIGCFNKQARHSINVII